MKTFKFLSPFLFLLIVLCTTGIAFGASPTTPVFEVPKGASATALPQPARLTIKDIVLDSKSYKAGDTVSGAFTFVNQDTDPISDAGYSISLAGDYQPNTLASTFYDTKILGPVFLNGGQEKRIPFSYVLPQAVSKGNYGIQIQARLKSGQPLGWADSFITVTSGISPVIVANSYIEKAKGEYFTLEAGPTIKKSENASVIVTIKNPSLSALDLVPQMSIFNRTETGAKLSDTNSQSVNVPAGKTTDVRIELPLFNYKAGVYAGTVRFVDKDGIDRASLVRFRYIIDGPVATIQSITSGKQFADKDETVLLTLMVSGTPFDITTGNVPNVGSAELSVSLYNENDIEVAQGIKTIDLEKMDSTISMPLVVSEQSGSLKAKAEVTKDGEVIAGYEVSLSSGIHTFANAGFAFTSYSIMFVILFCVLLLLIALFLKLRKNQKTTMAIIILVAIGISGIILAKGALASFVVYEQQTVKASPPCCGPQPIWNPTLYVNDLVISNGQYYLTGTAVMNVCLNQPTHTQFDVAYQDPALKGGYSNHTNITSYDAGPRVEGAQPGQVNEQFALGPFPAMSVPGTYRTYLSVYDQRNAGGLYTFGYTKGYIDYIVTDNGTTVGGGGGCPSGQFYCELLKQCIANNQQCNASNPNYVPPVINPNIPAVVGPVKLKNLTLTPPLGNAGYSCRVAWNDAFTSYDTNTVCTFSGPNKATHKFNPTSTDAPLYYDSGALTKDSLYKMSCSEGSNSVAQNIEGVCRLSNKYVEVN